MGLTLIGGFAMSSFFVFIASASFVYTEQFGLSPTGFSLAFALNAIGFFAASQMAASLGERFGMARVVGTAVAAFAAVTTALFLVALAGYATLPVIIAMLFVGNAFLGRGDADDDGDGARPAPGHRRARLLARRHAADGDRRGDDGAGGAVLRRDGDADARGDRAGGAARLRRGAPDLPAAAGAAGAAAE